MTTPSLPEDRLWSFVEEIKENPDDDVVRLVFADWLEEHGDPRGELLRAQVELAGLDGGDPRRPGLERRARELLGEHGEAWAGAAGHGCKWEFRRGFLHLSASGRELAGLTRWLAEAGNVGWVEGLLVRAVDAGAAGHLANQPWLRQITALALERVAEDAAAGVVQSLAASPHLGRVRRLDLSRVAVGRAGAAALARPASLGRMTSLNLAHASLDDPALHTLGAGRLPAAVADLDVSNNFLTHRAAESLATSGWKRLARLRLGGNDLGDRGAEALASADNLGGLASLDLHWNHVGPAGVAHLARSPHLGNLADLDLASNPVGVEGARALAASPRLGRLQTLRLRRNALGPQGAAALASGDALTGLRTLDLESADLGERGLEALASADWLGGVRHLLLARNQIQAPGVVALAGTARPPRLLSLDLSRNPIRAEGARALAGWSALAELRVLKLAHCDVPGHALQALIDSPHLGALAELDLTANKVTPAVARSLAESPRLGNLRRLRVRDCALPAPELTALRVRFGEGVESGGRTADQFGLWWR